MKRLVLVGALALAGCNFGVQSAGTQVGTSGLDFYTAASKAGEVLVQKGLLDKAAFKADDNVAYGVAVKVDAGTATFQDLVTAAQPLFGSK